MPGNLKERLKRIQAAEKSGQKKILPVKNTLMIPGWYNAGYMTLKREIYSGERFIFPKYMPEAAVIVMPGITGQNRYEDLLFFDLETTGLSGGAGTIAFLAAFGRFEKRADTGDTAEYDLLITQYLLLDYPGENDFVTAILGEFKNNRTIVSYNGKCFDAQILNNRCLMNGIFPPEYLHADLLYPARRLWKTILPDCSQSTIETAILGLDRSGDIPGALAPEIWFSFLKTGDTGPLIGICGHNQKDIAGLASVFGAMVNIAECPITAMRNIKYDTELLAIRWHQTPNKHLHETGLQLLKYAAENNYPRAQLLFAKILFDNGDYDGGRDWLLKTAANGQVPHNAAALRTLAIDSERRLKNPEEALQFSEKAIQLLPPESSMLNDFENRIIRLNKKISR